jgi:gas vesicle protein
MAKNTFKKFAIGTALAAVAGYLAGILTAPKSGKETRADIKDAAAKGITEAEKQLKKAHTELSNMIDEAKLKGANMSDKARKELDVLVDKAKVSKEKAREVLSAIHEGDAEDQDLQRAIKEATNALNHLRTYLTK